MGHGQEVLIAAVAIFAGIWFSNTMDKRRAKRKAEREAEALKKAEAFRKYQQKQKKETP